MPATSKAQQKAAGAALAAKRGEDPSAEEAAHAEVDRAKRALGERGPVWWDDGAPDLNRHMARNTPYADWFATVDSDDAREHFAS